MVAGNLHLMEFPLLVRRQKVSIGSFQVSNLGSSQNKASQIEIRGREFTELIFHSLSIRTFQKQNYQAIQQTTFSLETRQSEISKEKSF